LFFQDFSLNSLRYLDILDESGQIHPLEEFRHRKFDPDFQLFFLAGGANLANSHSVHGFSMNENFTADGIKNGIMSAAQKEFDAEIEKSTTSKSVGYLKDKKNLIQPPLSDSEIADLAKPENRERREALLKQVGAVDPDNKAKGSSRPKDDVKGNALGELAEGFRNLGNQLGIGSSNTHSASGFVDAEGKFHPRTCFVKGTLVTIVKREYRRQIVSSIINTPSPIQKELEHRMSLIKPSSEYEIKIPIEEVKPGDYTLSWNEKTKEKSYKKVIDSFTRTADLIYTITYASGEKIQTTWNHPFWIVDNKTNLERGPPSFNQNIGISLFGGIEQRKQADNTASANGTWKQAKDLKAGDFSITSTGKSLLITKIETLHKQEIVYNFSVADNSTYYVGRDGVLVHNQDVCKFENTGSSFDILSSEENDLNYLKEKQAADDYKKFGEFPPLKSKERAAAEIKIKLKEFREGKSQGYGDGFHSGWISLLTPHIGENVYQKYCSDLQNDPKKSPEYKDGYNKTAREGFTIGYVAITTIAAGGAAFTARQGVIQQTTPFPNKSREIVKIDGRPIPGKGNEYKVKESSGSKFNPDEHSIRPSSKNPAELEVLDKKSGIVIGSYKPNHKGEVEYREVGKPKPEIIVIDLKNAKPAYNAAAKNGNDNYKDKLKSGNEFNKDQSKNFKYNEVYVDKGNNKGSYKKLDSYNPKEEIVSRKETQLSDIQPKTAKAYIDEAVKKYSPGTKLADVPSNKTGSNAGVIKDSENGKLSGKLYLDIPKQNKPIPKEILDYAQSKFVEIREVQKE
jgi:hypothetical protein